MAPIKLEEHIKDKLEQRQLKPSASAWKRLSEKLDAEESTNTKNNWWWLGLAASIIGILLVIFIVNNQTNTPNQPVIVDKPQEVIDKEVLNSIKNEVVENENQAEAEHVNKNPVLEVTEGNVAEVKESEAVIENDNLVKKIMNKPTETVAVTVTPIDNVTETLKEHADPLTFEQQKVQEVANKIKQLQENNSTVTEGEIETLLAEAQKEIQLNKSYNETTNTVDATLLLQDVEFELDKSFRDKVFETLESGYVIVKNAVIDRDNN